MPALPSYTQVHVNAPLTNIAEQYLMGDEVYVAHQAFPIVPVNKISDRILRICRKDMFMLDDVRPRAPGAPAQGRGFHIDWNSTYFCREYAFAETIADEERANADAPLQLETTAVQMITQLLKLKREELWAAVAMNAASWTNMGVFGGGAWNLAGSTPIVDIDNAKIRMALTTGFQPNTLIINKQVFYNLRRHANLVAIYRNLGTAQPVLSVDQVAAALDIERVLVAKSVYDAGPMQGQWDGRFVVPNDALLCYVASAPSTKEPSAGYTFSYNAANHAGLNVQIETYRMPIDHKADKIVGNVHFDVQVVEPDLGVYFSNAIAGAGILNQVVCNVPICQ